MKTADAKSSISHPQSSNAEGASSPPKSGKKGSSARKKTPNPESAPSSETSPVEREREKTAALTELFESPREIWSLFFDESPNPLFIYDTETLSLLRVNAAMVDLYGYSIAEFDRLSLSELYFEADQGVLPLPGLEGKGRREVKHRHRDGAAVYVELTSQAIQFEGRPARLVQGVNTTEKREMESRFLRAQRLECLGMLASGVAHDLNNILAPILMSASMLREELPEEAKEEFLTAIEHSAQRGAKLLKQVLAFVRGAEGEQLAIRPDHLMSEVVEMIRQTFPRGIQVKSEIEPNLPEVRGEATKLYQVFLNLAVNARDAMNGSGTLEIKARYCELDASCMLKNAEARPGSFVAFSVRDSGCGMSPEVLQKIFIPFFTTKLSDQGTGLGLPTVEGIVKAHGGVIQVESEVNVGTTFTVYLPTLGDLNEESHPHEALKGHGEYILVADDDIELRKLLKTILGRHGYRVVTASNGTEAMAVYVRKQGKVEIVLADLVMPQMDGVVLARAIKRLNPQAKIIASFGIRSENRMEELAALGVTDLLRKPYQPHELLEVISRVLNAPKSE